MFIRLAPTTRGPEKSSIGKGKEGNAHREKEQHDANELIEFLPAGIAEDQAEANAAVS